MCDISAATAGCTRHTESTVGRYCTIGTTQTPVGSLSADSVCWIDGAVYRGVQNDLNKDIFTSASEHIANLHARMFAWAYILQHCL